MSKPLKTRTVVIVFAVFGAIIIGASLSPKPPTYQQEVAKMSPTERKQNEVFQQWRARCGRDDWALDVAEHPNNTAYMQRCLNAMTKRFNGE